MLKYPNSLISFICSFNGLAMNLDYLFWPRTIKASESIEQGFQIKIIGCVVFYYSRYILEAKPRKMNFKMYGLRPQEY